MEEEEEEDYISYGTPVPDIEDEAVAKKRAIRELQVRDEKGRQRFHGAFTGGFSAGYFNTVGTKEGWAPSSFISSRSKISERIHQNPEDFMDEDDLGEFGIATRKIHTTSNFQDHSEEAVRKRKFVDVDAIIPGEAPLKDIVKPVRESIGIKILRKLGWKPGQGIGPRVKKQQAGRIYGCSLNPEDLVPEEEDHTALAFTFAPEDTEAIFYKPKENYFGLGYAGLSKESVLTSRIDEFAPTTTKSWLKKDKRKLTISGQAFGVGAFEDDDDDIYSKDDMSQYDFSEISVKASEVSSKEDSKHAKSSDSVLEGFSLASHPPFVKKHFPPPTLPPDFKPIHQKTFPTHGKPQNMSRHSFSAEQRSLILGEKKFYSQPLDDDTKREKMQASQDVTFLNTCVKPGSTFQPFPNDISKQQRYEQYLKLKESGEIEKLKQPSSMTEWEKQQEVEEFDRAALLFKPLSSVLSSRFESRSHLSVEHEVMSALEKIKKEKDEKHVNIRKKLIGTSNRKTIEWHPASLLCKRFNVPNPFPNSISDGAPKAKNRKSLFDPLLFIDQTNEHQEVSKSLSSSNLKNKADELLKGNDGKKESEDSAILSNVLPAQSKENNSLEKERPPIDFFKDIFENSSSDDENETKEGSAQNSKASLPVMPLTINNKEAESSSSNFMSESMNVEKNLVSNEEKIPVVTKKAGFGVFANIDLDALNKKTPKVPVLSTYETMDTASIEDKNITEIKEVKDNSSLRNTETSLANDLYGPELPPNYSVSVHSSSDKFAEKKHLKHKSKHKHKHHKHKSSKKKKKKSSRKHSEESGSSDEPEDIPPTLIIEKFKELQKQRK